MQPLTNPLTMRLLARRSLGQRLRMYALCGGPFEIALRPISNAKGTGKLSSTCLLAVGCVYVVFLDESTRVIATESSLPGENWDVAGNRSV
jgi:hypothetical protein